MTRVLNRLDRLVLGFAWGVLATTLLAVYAVPLFFSSGVCEPWFLLGVVAMGIFAGRVSELDERGTYATPRYVLVFFVSLAIALYMGHRAYTAAWGIAAMNLTVGSYEFAASGLLFFVTLVAVMLVYRLFAPPARNGWHVSHR